MFKKVLLSLCFIFALNTLFAQDLAYILPQAEPTLDDIQNLVEQGNYPLATQILEQAYQEAQTKQEKEEITFILASIATKDEDYNRAVRLYRQLLNFNPSLTMARFNLAWVYFLKKEYEGARFNMKLALAQEDLPEEMRMQGNWLLYEIRQKKVWNAQIQVGIAPDTNINGVSGKQIECFYYAGLPFCRKRRRDTRLRAQLSGRHADRLPAVCGLAVLLHGPAQLRRDRHPHDREPIRRGREPDRKLYPDLRNAWRTRARRDRRRDRVGREPFRGGCVWNATPRSLSPLERNIGFWTQA